MIILALGYVLVVFVMFVATLSIVKHNSLLSLIVALSISIATVLATMFLLANIMSYFIVGILMMWLRFV